MRRKDSGRQKARLSGRSRHRQGGSSRRTAGTETVGMRYRHRGFRSRYPEWEIPQSGRIFQEQGAKKLTSFGQFCALFLEYSAVLGISPLRIKLPEPLVPVSHAHRFRSRRPPAAPVLPVSAPAGKPHLLSPESYCPRCRRVWRVSGRSPFFHPLRRCRLLFGRLISETGKSPPKCSPFLPQKWENEQREFPLLRRNGCTLADGFAVSDIRRPKSSLHRRRGWKKGDRPLTRHTRRHRGQ